MPTKKKATAKPAAKPKKSKPAAKPQGKPAAQDLEANGSQAQAWERGASIACAADESCN